MPTIALPLGVAVTLVAGTSVALPAKAVQITVQGAGTQSVSNDNSTFANMTLDSNNNFQTSAAFLKSTGTPIVIAKAL